MPSALNSSLQRLVGLMLSTAQNDGDRIILSPRLEVFRHDRPGALPPCVYEPGVALIACGAKRVCWSGGACLYRAGEALLTAVDAPVASAIAEASPSAPYLGLYLRFDRSILADYAAVAEEAQAAVAPAAPWKAPLAAAPAGAPLVDAFSRLLEAALALKAQSAASNDSAAAPVFQPHAAQTLCELAEREAVVRLLSSGNAGFVQAAVRAFSPDRRLSSAIAWLRRHYQEPFELEALAERAAMNASTFRQKFKALTGASPLQFQKRLRLSEARRLILEGADAAQAGYAVGYGSASQFHREYRRLFGRTPMSEMRPQREAAAS